jgi:hypothetical protein
MGLLNRADSGAGNASNLLARYGMLGAQVVRVDIDSILFTHRNIPMTAWLKVKPGSASPVVVFERGFSAERGVLFGDETVDEPADVAVD